MGGVYLDSIDLDMFQTTYPTEEDFWDAILSRQPELVRQAYETLAE
jgi:hypothetical protein